MVGARLWIPSPRNLASRLGRRQPILGPEALQPRQVTPGFASELSSVKVTVEMLLRVHKLYDFMREVLRRVCVRPWAVSAPVAAAVIPAVDKCNAETAAWKRDRRALSRWLHLAV